MEALTIPGVRELMKSVIVGALATAFAALLAYIILGMLAQV